MQNYECRIMNAEWGELIIDNWELIIENGPVGMAGACQKKCRDIARYVWARAVAEVGRFPNGNGVKIFN